MKIKGLAAAAVLAMSGHAAQAEGDVAAGKAIFDRICAECHYDNDFAGRSSEDILGLIKQMAALGSQHKFDLNGLDERELTDVAAFLASVE